MGSDSKLNAEERLEPEVAEAKGGRAALLDEVGDRLELPHVAEVEGLPEIAIGGESTWGDINSGSDTDHERMPDFQYKLKPETYRAKDGESLDQVIDRQKERYLREEFQTFSADPGLMDLFERTLRRALVELNGLSDSTALAEGQSLTLPGLSENNNLLFQIGQDQTYWSLDNSVTVRNSKSEVIRTDYPDGRYQIVNPDGSREEKDLFGVIQRSRRLDDGVWLIEGSDGSYKRFNPADDSQESLDKYGTLVLDDGAGNITTTYSDGSIFRQFRDSSTESVDADKVLTRTSPDGRSEIFDGDGNRIGEGVNHNQFTIRNETVDDGVERTLHSRSRPEFSLTLAEMDDGSFSLRERGSEADLEFVDSPPFEDLAESRRELLVRVDQNIESPIMKAKFKADMIRFENRAKERGLSSESLEKSYQALTKLLDMDKPGVVDGKRREQLASEVMNNLAKPYTVSQGRHGTCNVKILDVLLNAKHPDKVANMIAEVATTGKYTLPSGKIVDVPAGTLQPSSDAVNYPRWNGERGFAGQIFDSTVINSHLQDHNMGFRFDQVPIAGDFKSGDVYVNDKTGQVLRDENGKPVEFQGLYVNQIVEAYRLVMGDNDASRDWILDPNSDTGEGDGIKGYRSKEQLSEILTTLKEEGAFPYPIHINVKMPPFWNDSGAGYAGGSSGPGNHVLNITDFDPKTARVSIDNQWSTYNDRTSTDKAVPLEQLYRASLYPGVLQLDLALDALQSFKGAGDSALDKHRLSIFNQAIQGADPEYLASGYEELTRGFARQLRETKPGDPGYSDDLKLYRELTAEGKLTVLDELSSDGKIPETFVEADFNREFISLAENYGVVPLDIVRGLAARPGNLAEARDVGLDFNTRENVTYLKGKLALVHILTRLPEEHRERIIEGHRSAFIEKEAENRRLAYLGAE